MIPFRPWIGDKNSGAEDLCWPSCCPTHLETSENSTIFLIDHVGKSSSHCRPSSNHRGYGSTNTTIRRLVSSYQSWEERHTECYWNRTDGLDQSGNYGNYGSYADVPPPPPPGVSLIDSWSPHVTLSLTNTCYRLPILTGKIPLFFSC